MARTARGGVGIAPGNYVLPLLGVAVLALAFWARSAAVPNIARRGGPGAMENVRVAALADLQRNVRQTLSTLERAAQSALRAPSDPAGAFAAISGLQGDAPEWGVIVFDSTEAVAWSGRIRVPVDTVTAPLAVISNSLYTALAVTRRDGRRRAVAVAVIQAAPPADRVAPSVAQQVAGRHAIQSFAVQAPAAAGRTSVLITAAGTPLLSAEVVPLSLAEIRLQSAARVRARVAIVCGLFLLLLICLAARRAGPAGGIVALAIGVAALGLIPFNEFSRASRVFDPTYYFSTAAGPWSANGGVLLLTSIAVALAVIAVVRGRPMVRNARGALAAGVALAASGYFVIRALAGGIGQPARGATVTLWLGWEIPLFLIAIAFALPIAWAFDTGVRRRRRLTRASFILACSAAAVIAASLVWLTSVGQRIRLAEADVSALHEGEDEYLDVLLTRFAQALDAGAAPRNRVELLRAYAESELAIAGYSLALARWSPGGEFLESVDLTFGLNDSALARPVVEEAIAAGEIRAATVAGPVGAVWVAAIPHSSGGLTSVVALPRSRLVAPGPYAALLGIRTPPADDPAYTITVAEGIVPPERGSLQWRRMGRELHADAPLLTANGLAQAHVEIDLRSPEGLGQRLFLVVLLNLAIAGVLALLVRVSEPGFGRRTRVRFRHWIGSFRSRLTLALFAFFVIPAAAFTIWGYSRLAAENRQLRRLVVRETLHAASVARDSESLPSLANRLRAPLFEYSDGLQSATSDTLLDVLAPLGRTLPPEVQLHLTQSGELTANWEQDVADTRVLVGYRTILSPPAQVVLAAPARGSDEMVTRRARDLGVLLLFATALGALAALWLSGVAAHQFGRPIAALRRAARAVARGDRRPPELPSAPSEFEPVFAAFRRMAADLERSRVELARAERVLAWGEMARQVAHEIKNPLTPIRLGVQYLQRARRDARVNFDQVFEENTERILREIDRLDEIARAFSRYGSAPTELPPPEPVDVAFVLRDLVAFETMGGGNVAWILNGADGPCWATARREELREALMNVFENSRAARARRVSVVLSCETSGESGEGRVVIRVEDDGMGISREVLPRIFEPHFSTRTTGSGLGLAISRRLLDAWGGSISIDSRIGEGTVVNVTLRPADAVTD